MTTWLHIPDDYDGLLLCTTCKDRYTTNPRGVCHVCREQEMIDDDVPTPFDWSVWDEEDEDN